MARHRRPRYAAIGVRPRVVRRFLVPAATLVTVGVISVSTAFACSGSSSASPASSETRRQGAVVTAVRDAETYPPSSRDASAIVEAVRTSPFTSAVPARNYEVSGTELAASDPSWALTELRPTVPDLDRAKGVLHRTTTGWVLVQLGTYEVGCGVAPSAVLRDLHLDCPPPDGSGLTT